MTPLSRLGDLARRQHRTISGAQLAALGFDKEKVRHLVRTQRIWRVFRGVYALEGPLEPIGWLKAAELACGERAMARRFSAAALLELRTWWPELPEIVIGTTSGATGPPGVLISRSCTLRRRDVAEHRGVRTTSVPRTIIDCSRHLGPGGIKGLLRQAEFHHGTDLTTLDRPGLPRALRSALRFYVLSSGLTASELEARFVELLASIAFPLPQRQERRGEFRLDFVWPELRLVVETDGRSAHDRSVAFTEDRRRDRRLTLDGWTVLRFTWAEVAQAPEDVIADLRRVELRPWTLTSSTTRPTAS